MKKIVQQAVNTFDKEGVILYPTSTVWGLGCDPFSKKAVEAIYTIKKRDRNKPLIVLVKDQEQLQKYTGKLPTDILALAKATEPTSIVYPNIQQIPAFMLAQNGSLAIRITQHPFCIQLIENTNKPLVSTSANLAGEPTPKTFTEISQTIKIAVDFTVPKQFDQNSSTQNKSSRLFVWNKQKQEIAQIRP